MKTVKNSEEKMCVPQKQLNLKVFLHVESFIEQFSYSLSWFCGIYSEIFTYDLIT